MALRLARARVWPEAGERRLELAQEPARAASVHGTGASPGREADLAGRWVLPGLVNAHDHLDAATLPALARPPYASLYAWVAEAAAAEARGLREALAVPLTDRLFLGGLRQLLCGATAVAHHGAWHRSLARPDFPVRVLARYQFGVAPGLTPHLRRSYRTTDRRIPWFVHAAEGTDTACRDELDALVAANVLRQNTVVVHAIGLRPADPARLAAARAAVVWCPESDRRLYGATAPVEALLAAGVRLGLGIESPAAGGRDALSNLAAARTEGLLSDAQLLELATRGSAEVARLTAGGVEPPAPADLLVADALPALLGGDRRAVALVLVGGWPLYGDTGLMEPLAPGSQPIRVDGADKRLAAPLARRLAALLRTHPALRGVGWLAGVQA